MARSPADTVAPDGSPVALYLALPPHDALDLVADQVPLGGSVLDLGCGVGRLANPLSELGAVVTAVDEHAAMLEHLAAEVEPVPADIATLDLGRTFDVVVLASHLVNHHRDGSAFLATCRRHVDGNGAVLIERFHPDMLDDLDHREGVMDGVRVRHEVHHHDGLRFGASAHYTVGDTTWVQRYEALILDDAAFDRALHATGLGLVEWLDDQARWALARPRGPGR
jgi:SAM-dependent methyltransferase